MGSTPNVMTYHPAHVLHFVVRAHVSDIPAMNNSLGNELTVVLKCLYSIKIIIITADCCSACEDKARIPPVCIQKPHQPASLSHRDPFSLHQQYPLEAL